jgi:chemotaxis protein MotB
MSRHRGRRGGHAEEHADERWLLTYADMITLLMALFIVMWSVSVVNKGKFDELKVSLREAFSHKPVLQGDRSIMASTGSPSSAFTIVPAVLPPRLAVQRAFRKAEEQNLERVQQQIRQAAATEGLARALRTHIEERGLVVRLLTDKVLFTPGQAVVEPGGRALLVRVARTLATVANPLRVEGNTDSTPISNSLFHSNWELSAARATAVLEVLHESGIPDDRLSVAGYAAERPVAPNTTSAGRALNRRVDIVVLRRQR